MAVNRNLMAFAALNGAAAVALGAFAAHGAGPQIKTLLTTGAQYQLAHALLVRPLLKKIFAYRRQSLALLLGGEACAPPPAQSAA